MKISTLIAIQAKNPKFTTAQINLVANRHLVTLSKSIDRNLVFNLKVPKLGTVHTHGNTLDKIKRSIHKAQVKCHKMTADFSDNKLLF